MTIREDSPIIVIGRGHSGTRILAHTLYASGVHMGRFINMAGDKIPPDEMYDACRIIGQNVDWGGDLSWDFSRLHTMRIDSEFVEKVDSYLRDVFMVDKPHKGWKLPETTLAYPWIARMFPQARYIYVVRDPRDCLLGPHKTDDLGKFGVPGPQLNSKLDQRVASWKYQYDIIKATPQPESFLPIRYEELVLDYERTVGSLEAFLGIPLGHTIVNPTRIGQWKRNPSILDHIHPLEEAMHECGYS